MKKLFLPFLAALVLPFACTVIEESGSELEHAEGQTEAAKSFLVISASSSTVTKAVLNEDKSVSFVDTDALSVFDSEYQNCFFTVKKLYPDGSSDFEGSVSGADGPMPVMYPYQESARLEKSSPAIKLFFEIPQEQHAVKGSFDPAAAISLGMAEMAGDGLANAKLVNVCSLVKFTMPEGHFSKVTLIASKGAYICGECNVNVNNGIGVLTIMEEAKTVSLVGEIEGGETYYLSVLPGTAENGITVRIYDANGDLAGEKSTTKAVTFTKNRILNIGTLPTVWDSPEWIGEGTESSPYIIATKEHLKQLADAFSSYKTALPYAGNYFKQVSDIDMDGEAITIGNYDDGSHETGTNPTAFNANYDGGGHTISNYRLKFISRYLSVRCLAGLFNIVSDATISNLNLQPAVQESGYLIDGLDSSVDNYYIGLLAGEIDGVCTISNCHVLSGDYTVTADDGGADIFGSVSQSVAFGGLVGLTTAGTYKTITFSNCTNEANLKIEKGRVQDVVGGIIGTNYGGAHYQYVDCCRNKGSISVVSEKAEVFAGGIIGRITDTGNDVAFFISNCVNEGDIHAENNTSEDACAGGIAGSNNSDGWFDTGGSVDPWVYNCLNKGDIHAKCLDGMLHVGYDAYAGGIFGYCWDSDTKLALCVNVGRISAEGSPQIGPICGVEGDHLWCFWFDEFGEDYKPDDCYHCYPCSGFIKGSGSNAGTPEYVRLHGKASDSETGDTLFEKTEWSQSQWASAAAWKGESNSYWGTSSYQNTLDLDF